MSEYMQYIGLIIIGIPVVVIGGLMILGLVGSIFSHDIRMIVVKDKKKRGKRNAYVKEIRKWSSDPDNDHLNAKYGD